MYDKKARQKLLGKLDYELWLLNTLAEQQVFDGGTEIATFQISSKDTNTQVDLDSGTVNALWHSNISSIMTPLVFTASYKMLDVIFEWILEENHRAGKIQEVPWPFQKKLKLLKGRSKLQYPPLFISKKYLHSYSEALFRSLLPYRNDIVHKNAFSVCGDRLILSDSKHKTQLILNRVQLGRLVGFVVTLAQGLAGDLEVNSQINRLLKYCLDSLTGAHGKRAFNQDEPLIVNVEFTVSERCGSYLVDLKKVKDKVNSKFPNRDVFFNLTVMAVDGERLVAKWYFEEEDVPTGEELPLDENSYEAYRVD